MKNFSLFSILFLMSFQALAQNNVTALDSVQVASVVTDSLGVETIPSDSTAIANKLSSALKDSLNNQMDIPVQMDSTLTDQAKSKAKRKLSEDFNTNIPTDSASVANKAKSSAVKAINDETGVDIKGVPTDSAAVGNKAKALLTNELNHQTGVNLGDVPTDSTSIRNEAKRKIRNEFTDKTGIETPDITIDSTTTDQLKSHAENKAESAIKGTDEFTALEDSELDHLTNELGMSPEEMKQMEARQVMKQQMAAHAKGFISENTEKIQQVQEQMTELKSVYSEVPNSTDLSTAKKRSSLKGESFWKRLVIGGNLNLTETNPVTIDFSPVLGWKFNKAFEVGVTGAYRAKFGADQNGINSYETEDVYGYSVFAQHMAFKNFFGYLEGENISKVVGTEEDNQRQWNKSLLVGIGRKFKVAPFLEMQAIITYNFLHDNASGVYNSPVGFKTGFRVVK